MEIRQLREHERHKAVNLSNKTFRNDDQKSMGEAFPSIFSSSMIHHSFGAFDQDKLVSFMGLVPSIIRIGEAKLNVFSLGSVCTAEEYRNKGIASEILDKVYKYIDSSNASLLLVSGDRSLYTRANCCHFGKVYTYTIRHIEVNKLIEKKIREMRNEDLLQMCLIAQAREVSYEQSVTDLQTMIHSEAYASCLHLTHKTIVVENEGEICSFLVLGLPDSNKTLQKAIVIEWAGNAEDMKRMLSFALKTYNLEEIEIVVPWSEQQLQSELKDHPYKNEKNQGTVHIVNVERLLVQLQPYLKTKLLNPLQFKQIDHEHVQVSFLNQKITLHTKDFVSLLFDLQPGNIKIAELQNELMNVLPIPFPYTAGLHYV